MWTAVLASNRHVYANDNSHNCCHQVRFLGCRYAKNAFMAEALPRTPLGELTVVPRSPSCCLSLYLKIDILQQGPGKCFWVLESTGKVLEFFITKRLGTLH